MLPSKKVRVGLIFGGHSGEHEVSLVSASCIYKALDPKKYDVSLIGIDRNGRWSSVDPEYFLSFSKNPRSLDLSTIQSEPPITLGSSQKTTPGFDVIIPILHGPYGEDGTVQGFLELAQIPYVGSGVLGSSVGMDKDVSKRLLRDAGIPVAPFLTVRRKEWNRDPQKIRHEAERTLGYPIFVKPCNMGSSVGVHKIKNASEFETLVTDAFSYDIKALLEAAVPQARELECSVLESADNTHPRVSVVGEIIPHHEFYTYEAKYLDDHGADLVIPAHLSTDLIQQIQKLAANAFEVLECNGLARVDFLLSASSHELYLNEINTLPGFTPISMYPKLWEASGLKYDVLLDELILLAQKRFQQRSALKIGHI